MLVVSKLKRALGIIRIPNTFKLLAGKESLADSGNKTAASAENPAESGESVPAAATVATTNGVQQPAPDIEIADEAAEKLQDLAV